MATLRTHVPVWERSNATEHQQHQNSAIELGRMASNYEGFELLEPEESPFGERLREELEARIIGQPEAIKAVINAIDRLEVRPDNDCRPIASLALLGPTGVGKTETARVLADILSQGSDKGLVTINCSEYSHGHEVARLIGAPPGYVGYDVQKPRLNKERIEDSDGTVVLFDEIEKAAPALHDLLLQIMGGGQLQLNDNSTVQFRNTVVILTSNVGGAEINALLSGQAAGFGDRRKYDASSNTVRSSAVKAFERRFRPELRGRLTPIVYMPLDDESMEKVLDVKMTEANQAYMDKFGIHVSLSETCRDALVSGAKKDAHLGVRPLIDQLDMHVHAKIGRLKSADSIPNLSHVKVFSAEELPDLSRSDCKESFVIGVKPNSVVNPRVIAPLALTNQVNSNNIADASDYEQVGG